MKIVIENNNDSDNKNPDQHTGYRGKPVESGPYYHGSSTILGIQDLLLPPTETNIQTEPRVQRRGKVFFTNNLEAAQRYANVAVKKWGGEPIIYLVEPEGPIKQMTGKKDIFGPIFTAARARVKKMDSTIKENKQNGIRIKLFENKQFQKNFPQKISEADPEGLDLEQDPKVQKLYQIAKELNFYEGRNHVTKSDKEIELRKWFFYKNKPSWIFRNSEDYKQIKDIYEKEKIFAEHFLTTCLDSGINLKLSSDMPPDPNLFKYGKIYLKGINDGLDFLVSFEGHEENSYSGWVVEIKLYIQVIGT